MWDSWDSPIYTCVPLYRPILCVRPIPMSYMGQMGQSYRIPCVPPYRPILHVCVRPILSHCPMWDGWNSPMESHVYHSTVNSLHAADLYIDFMNNSLAKKEKKRERKLPNRGTNSRRIYENRTRYPPSHARNHNVLSLYGPYKPIRSVWLRYYHATLPRAMS